MKDKELKQLLERYWQGESTLEEERTLREYFNKGDIADEYRALTGLFKYPGQAKHEQKLGQEFEEKVLRNIRKKAGRNRPHARTRLLHQARWLQAAAIVLVAAGIFYLLQPAFHTGSPSEPYTIEDPEIAYRETKQALLLVAEKLNNGSHYLEHLGTFDEARNTINETLKMQ